MGAETDVTAPRIVCIGASWGGLEALRALLSALPQTVPWPVCVVQHRGDDEGRRLLPQLLDGATSLSVCEPDDKDVLEAGHVYVAPPGYHMLVDHGRIALSLEEPVRWSRPSIDVLFESAADALGSGVVAVVLTGANDDGTRGAAAVHTAGGTVLVQDPETAERPEMPRAAIRAGHADHVLDLAGIAAWLGARARDARGSASSYRGGGR